MSSYFFKSDPLYANIELSSYPTYHTSYETFELIENYLDPKFEVIRFQITRLLHKNRVAINFFFCIFKSFKLITVIVGELTRRISEALILPFNCATYAEELEKEFLDFENTYKSDFAAYKIDFDPLRWAISNFSRVAIDFHKRLSLLDKSKYKQI